jgi:phosphoribosylformylglycinamidine cyclo-ligase
MRGARRNTGGLACARAAVSGNIPADSGRRVRRERYAESGVDTDAVERALSRLILELAPTQDLGARSEVGIGHFAAVVRAGPVLLALTTDGVGSKLLIAQLAHRYYGAGIDCVAMNVNDLLCVGAAPLAMLDYIAVEEADPDIFAEIGRGLAEGARQAGISIVGGETALIREMLRGAVKDRGIDLVGMAVGIVPEGELSDGSAIEPGDAVIGIASSGLHSNGFSLVRSVLLAAYRLDQHVPELGGPLVDELLAPTRIYVPEVRNLRAAQVELRAIAHITGDGLLNMRRVQAPVGFELDRLPEVPPIFQLIESIGEIERAEMRAVFNMGVGLTVVVPEAHAARALAALSASGARAWRIGRAFADPERRIRIPVEGLVGHARHFVRESRA